MCSPSLGLINPRFQFNYPGFSGHKVYLPAGRQVGELRQRWEEIKKLQNNDFYF